MIDAHMNQCMMMSVLMSVMEIQMGVGPYDYNYNCRTCLLHMG